MIHLDTSFLIRALVRDSVESRRLRTWIARREPFGISAIAWAEFLCGPVTSSVVEDAADLLGEPSPLVGLDATLSAYLFNQTGRRRRTLPDCMIAATAINAGASLATANRADLERFAPLGLALATG